MTEFDRGGSQIERKNIIYLLREEIFVISRLRGIAVLVDGTSK